MSEIEKSEYIKVIAGMPWLYKSILEEIDKHVKNVKSILDVACGNGHLLGLIQEKYPYLELKGIDIDDYFIEKAREKYSCTFEIADGYNFKQKADLLISNLAFHHFERPQELISRMVENAEYGVIISDHVRPDTIEELQSRLTQRLEKHAFENSEFYKERGRESILEAYTKSEIKSFFKAIPYNVDLKFVDNDYNERFVAVIIK